MNETIQKEIDVLMEKLNWLHQSFKAGNYKNLSALEKQVFKEKLTRLYDVFTDAELPVRKQPETEAPVIEEKTVEKPVEQPPVTAQKVEVEEKKAVMDGKIENKPEKKVIKEEKTPPEINGPKTVLDNIHSSENRHVRDFIDLNKSMLFMNGLFVATITLIKHSLRHWIVKRRINQPLIFSIVRRRKRDGIRKKMNLNS